MSAASERRSVWLRVTYLWLALAAGGCATAMHGPTQRVDIRSTPPGATATVFPIDTRVTTPAELILDRKRVYTVRFEKDGYQCVMAPLDRSTSKVIYWNFATGVVVPLGPLFGVMRDVETGSAYSLVPAPLEVELRPLTDTGVEGGARCVALAPEGSPDGADQTIVTRAPPRERSAALRR